MTTNCANTYIVPTTANEITMPSQPAFSARAGAAQLNVTGDGTPYTVQFATELVDQNNDFDGTSTFTAPVTGIYQINAAVRMTGLTVAMTTGEMNIITTPATFVNTLNVGAARSGGNQYTFKNSVIVPLTATDTVTVTIDISGGLIVADVVNAASTFFSGALIA